MGASPGHLRERTYLRRLSRGAACRGSLALALTVSWIMGFRRAVCITLLSASEAEISRRDRSQELAGRSLATCVALAHHRPKLGPSGRAKKGARHGTRQVDPKCEKRSLRSRKIVDDAPMAGSGGCRQKLLQLNAEGETAGHIPPYSNKPVIV